jgi:hypothetical protein
MVRLSKSFNLYLKKLKKHMKRQSTIEKQKLVETLRNLDSKLKYKSTAWNDAIKSAFNSSGSFDFVNLVHSSPNTARKLVMEFK